MKTPIGLDKKLDDALIDLYLNLKSQESVNLKTLFLIYSRMNFMMKRNFKNKNKILKTLIPL